MRWTPDIDQLLLRKLLETHQFTVNTKLIADAWPEELEKPTPRAITERLVKIRQNGKNEGTSGNFSIGSGKGKKMDAAPRKVANRRKRTLDELNEDGKDIVKREAAHNPSAAAAYPSPPKGNSQPLSRRPSYNDENSDSDDLPTVEELLTPSKKMKTRGHRVATYQSDGERYDSEISDFAPTA